LLRYLGWAWPQWVCAASCLQRIVFLWNDSSLPEGQAALAGDAQPCAGSQVPHSLHCWVSQERSSASSQHSLSPSWSQLLCRCSRGLHSWLHPLRSGGHSYYLSAPPNLSMSCSSSCSLPPMQGRRAVLLAPQISVLPEHSPSPGPPFRLITARNRPFVPGRGCEALFMKNLEGEGSDLGRWQTLLLCPQHRAHPALHSTLQSPPYSHPYFSRD
jgi:hypothetical protein